MILLTAATPWESAPLARALGLSPADPFPPGSARLFRGKVGGREVLLVETGMGPLRTREALTSLNGTVPEAVVSSGLAGALQDQLRGGDLVADLRGAPLAVARRARAVAEELGVALHLGALLSEDAVVADPAAKARLGRERRAAAVDMESAAVREWAEGRRAPFLAIRAVLDAVDERLPDGVPAGDSWPDLARYALARWRDLPLLLRLARLRARGLRALSSFFPPFLEGLDPGASDDD